MPIVYILTNPAMPNLVKIGKTSLDEPDTRVSQLYTTGVPVPFEIEYACEVDNADEVERALHVAFGPSRTNPRREFFEIDPGQAIAILKLLDTNACDVTGQLAANDKDGITEQDEEASRRIISRRPRINFSEMGIPPSSVLISNVTEDTASVIDDRKVMFRNEPTHLSVATQTKLESHHRVAPGRYWTYQGRLLRDIYNETYNAV